MKQNMWPQLGVKDIAFSPHATPELRARLAKLVNRNASTDGLEPAPEKWINTGNTDCFGGHGTIASIGDYIKVLHSILVDDEKILKSGTVQELFRPQLTPESKGALKAILSSPMGASFVGDFPTDQEYDWGLGGILVTQSNNGRRSKGTMIWSGMANCFWFIDRDAGICGVFGAQVLPPGDPKVEEVIKTFEYDMYKRLAKL